MHHSIRFVLFACALTAGAQDSSQPQFTARELFYAAATPAAAKPAAAPPAAPKKAPDATPKKPTNPAPPSQVATAEAARVSAPPPASQPIAVHDTGAVMVKTALVTAPAPVNGNPLGLRYTILRQSGDDMVEVPPDTIFHSGDKVQLSVQTNGPGYLYVIAQGSSGTWQPMFPSPEVADGDNHVDGWSAKVLPPGSLMVLVEPVGTEKLFIVFSRAPEDGLEKMIYSLKNGQPAEAQPAGERAAAPPKTTKRVISASAEIPDYQVGELRENTTRDLIIEKVTEKTPGDKSAKSKENATYVVNRTGSENSRVVADVSLVHQ